MLSSWTSLNEVNVRRKNLKGNLDGSNGTFVITARTLLEIQVVEKENCNKNDKEKEFYDFFCSDDFFAFSAKEKKCH